MMLSEFRIFLEICSEIFELDKFKLIILHVKTYYDKVFTFFRE